MLILENDLVYNFSIGYYSFPGTLQCLLYLCSFERCCRVKSYPNLRVPFCMYDSKKTLILTITIQAHI